MLSPSPDAFCPQRQRRIVMFTGDQRIDRRILLEADALESDGWTVSVLAAPSHPTAIPDDPRVRRIGKDVEAATSWDAGRGLLAAYRCLGRMLTVNSRWLLTLRALGLSLYPGGADKFSRRLFATAIAEESAQIYVAHDLPMLPVAVAAAQRRGGWVVYDSHELFAEQRFAAPERQMWRRMEERLVGMADLVITVNPSIARELELRYRLESVAVIHNAERCKPARARVRVLHERLGLSPRIPILLYQGGLLEGRSLDLPIHALPLVKTSSLHLVYLGDGALADALVKLARRLGVNRRVHLLPAVPQSELLDYTASADSGLIPYQANCLNTYYCTPNKLFEMIAAGLPIIASDLPELRRLVAGYGIGLVGDTSTPSALAVLIDSMFEGEGPSRFDSALTRARRELSWEEEGRRLVGLYRELVKRRPKQQGVTETPNP